MSDVHDFVLNDLGGVSDAQLFRAEHISHIHHCLHDLLIFTINNIKNQNYFQIKIECLFIRDLLLDLNNKLMISFPINSSSFYRSKYLKLIANNQLINLNLPKSSNKSLLSYQ